MAVHLIHELIGLLYSWQYFLPSQSTVIAAHIFCSTQVIIEVIPQFMEVIIEVITQVIPQFVDSITAEGTVELLY